MSNIIRWFEVFPSRALELMQQLEPIALSTERIGSFSLLVAPALITAPYERLQTYANRKNPQVDYLRFPDFHRRFDEVMVSPFKSAPFWTPGAGDSLREWRCSQVTRQIHDPSDWRDARDRRPNDGQFWSDDILGWQTRKVWKYLRDSLAHWNVVTCDRSFTRFDEGGIMERLLLYRADRDAGPWDVITVTPDAFLSFLKCWAEFLAVGLGQRALAAAAAAE